MRKSSLAVGGETPIERFYGIGEKRAESFHKLGLMTASDLCYHLPRAYEPRGNVKTTGTAENGEVCSLILTLATEPKNAVLKGRMVMTKFTAFDADGMCSMIFFNQPYVKGMAHKGMTFRFFGKITREEKGVGFYGTLDGLSEKKGTCSMTCPVMEPILRDIPLRPLVPVYPLTAGISQKLMGRTVREAVEIVAGKDGFEDFLPEDLRNKYDLLPLHTALRQVHAPETEAKAASAVRRLAFDELYLFALSMMLSKDGEVRKAERPMEKADMTPFLSALPYAFTGAQERVAKDIYDDLTGGRLMNRLVVGDVGSGKTALAAYAVYLTLMSGRQASIMAPTEILARQHFEELSKLFEPFGFRTELLVGSMTASAKRKAGERLMLGVSQLVIGTHALIEDTVVFKDLSLAVIDEQHRFGARQRRLLAEKTAEVHLLCMSATPIPRTLAMVLYCDTDVSILDEMPPGRQKVDTFLVNESYRQRLNAFIRKNIEAGGQVYIVCPAVEEEEQIEGESGEKLSASDLIPLSGRRETGKRKAATAFAETLSEIFPEYRVAFVHGKLSGKEKDRIMTAFAAGEIHILVSTTVIEVGVNVPRATLMIVENAELFGLSALHQLRGRVGRGQKKSYCVLVSDSKTDKARERLKLLCETNDGFKVAEKDLEMRGPGDFLEQNGTKTRQSGEFDLGIASLARDLPLLYAAFDEAKALLARDPHFEQEEHRLLAQRLREKTKISIS